jgi:hypothetical protein
MYIEVANEEELDDLIINNWYDKTIEDFAKVYGNYTGESASISGITGKKSLYWDGLVKGQNLAGKPNYTSLYLHYDEENKIVSHHIYDWTNTSLREMYLMNQD